MKIKNICKILFLFMLAFFQSLFHPRSNILGKQLCNTSFLTNQFNQRRSVGDLDLTLNPNASTMYVVWQPGGSGTLVPGEGVILDDLGVSDYVGIDPLVDKRAADANAIEGVLIFDQKKATKVPGDRISIAKKGAVIMMAANDSILRGAKVALVLASPGYVVTLATEALFGKALDKALAQHDLIRVEILAEGVV